MRLQTMTLYILKIQGTRKIPDYIQIRDMDFTLVAYFRINNPRRALSRCNLLDHLDQIVEIAGSLPYGKIYKLEL
jgi:hypothetical protein